MAGVDTHTATQATRGLLGVGDRRATEPGGSWLSHTQVHHDLVTYGYVLRPVLINFGL
jgi:hypothetical protein